MIIDPLFILPLSAALLMAVSCSMVGVLLFVSRRLLVGEALSHAAYPGAVIAAAFSGSLSVMVLAALAALLGKFLIEWLIKTRKTSVDAALCFVLSSFFGLGVLLASYMQMRSPAAYKQALVFLYGQVATMTERHVFVYALFTIVVLLALVLFFKELKVYSFDSAFSIGLVPSWLPHLISILMALSIVISMRSVGVVLLSAMLVAPATAARQWSRRLLSMLIIAVFFGVVSALLGAYYSMQYDLPTGPLIAIISSLLAVFSLIVAPHRGLLARFIQRERFAWKCRTENAMKALYKKETLPMTKLQRSLALGILRMKGFIDKKGLTAKGEAEALQIIRLHRLFELYLTEQVGLPKEQVHRIAEEAEHYITPDLEQEIDEELNFPEKDPHKQPIPKRRQNESL